MIAQLGFGVGKILLVMRWRGGGGQGNLLILWGPVLNSK